MTNRYELIDCILRSNTRYAKLKVEQNTSPLLHIYRLLSGTIDVLDNYYGRKHKIRDNHLKLSTQKNTGKLALSDIRENFPEELSLSDINRYFDKAKNNLKFYSSIKTEVVKCLIASGEKRYFESFFYLYRILEGISYSIPLIYVSKKTDYNKTYHDLQAYFGKDKDGELAFFKRFVSETFKEENFYKSNIELDLSDIDNEDLRSSYFSLYEARIKPNYVVDKIENQSLKIKFIGFYDFVIELRNRFFHNSKGSWQQNFESSELLFPDVFFRSITKHGINWMSIILFEIIKVDFEKVKI